MTQKQKKWDIEDMESSMDVNVHSARAGQEWILIYLINAFNIYIKQANFSVPVKE